MAFDAVVVGAGPAGSTAATLMARKGHQVLLLDKSFFPRDKVCGDGMTPSVVHELKLAGLASVFDGRVPLSSGHVEGPSGFAFDVDVTRLRPDLGPGFVVPRKEFDYELVKLAVDAGATFVSGVSNTSFTRSGESVLVNYVSGGEGVSASAPLVIGADGANSVVRRWLGIPRNSKKANGVALRGYAESAEFVDGGSFGNTLWFEFNEFLLPAYGWVFPTGTGLCNIGVGLQQDQLLKRDLDLREVLERFVESLQERGANFGPLRDVKGHQLPHVREIPQLAHRGVALVGDAASLINPTTGEGIGYAVASSRILTESLPNNFHDPALLNSGLRMYSKRLHAKYDSHFRSVRLAQRLLSVPRWPNLVFRAAQRDDDVKAGAVDLLFGNGRITAASTFNIALANLKT